MRSLNLSIENHNVKNKSKVMSLKVLHFRELRSILLKNHLLLSTGFLEWPLVLKQVLSFPVRTGFIPGVSVFWNSPTCCLQTPCKTYNVAPDCFLLFVFVLFCFVCFAFFFPSIFVSYIMKYMVCTWLSRKNCKSNMYVWHFQA